MAVFNTILLSVCGVAVLASFVFADGQCIKGPYHEDEPKVGKGFPICDEYSNNTCCTKAFTVKLKQSRTEDLYNHTWDLCKPLSKECERYWLQQECFYQCSPNVYKWQHPSVGSAIHGVPICSSVCNGWFNACKNDHICVQDVLTGYEILANGTNRCPANSSCTTYADMFKDGEGLCNKMWNTSYVYTKENADKSNCMVMGFNGTNPNGNVQGPTTEPPSATGPSGVAVVVKTSVGVGLLGLMAAFAA